MPVQPNANDPVENGCGTIYRHQSLHLSYVFAGLAVVSLLGTYVLLGELYPYAKWPAILISALVPAAVCLLFAGLWRRDGQKNQALIDQAVSSETTIHWRLRDQSYQWFREKRRHRNRRIYCWIGGLPFAAGLLIGGYAGLINLWQGVSPLHSLRIGTAIFCVFTLVAIGLVGLRWVATYPRYRRLQPDGVDVFVNPFVVLAGDLEIVLGDWARSREVQLICLDDLECLQLLLTRSYSGRIYRMTAEIPLPEDQSPPLDAFSNMINLNAGAGLHQSRWGWYGR